MLHSPVLVVSRRIILDAGQPSRTAGNGVKKACPCKHWCLACTGAWLALGPVRANDAPPCCGANASCDGMNRLMFRLGQGRVCFALEHSQYFVDQFFFFEMWDELMEAAKLSHEFDQDLGV